MSITQRQRDLTNRYEVDPAGRWTDIEGLVEYDRRTPATRHEAKFYRELIEAVKLVVAERGESS